MIIKIIRFFIFIWFNFYVSFNDLTKATLKTVIRIVQVKQAGQHLMVRASVEPYSNLTYVLEYVEVLERNRGLVFKAPGLGVHRSNTSEQPEVESEVWHPLVSRLGAHEDPVPRAHGHDEEEDASARRDSFSSRGGRAKRVRNERFF